MAVESPFAWKVVAAAFVVATLSWGLSLYGLIAFIKVIPDLRGWPTAVVSGAVTVHFLFAALAVAFLTALHRRLGLAPVTFAGALGLALGVCAWLGAGSPEYLYLAALLTGWGWATTGAPAIRAMVAPWFSRRRPMALGIALSGATAGGVIFAPVWIGLIAVLNPVTAALLVGVFVSVTAALVSLLVLRTKPELPPPAFAVPSAAPVRPGLPLLTGPRFVTLTGAYTLALFAQMGVALHMLAVLSPSLGDNGAAWCVSLMSAGVMGGRLTLGAWIGTGDRRRAAAIAALLEGIGIAVFATAERPDMLAGACLLFGWGSGQLSLALPLIADTEFAPVDVPRVIAAATSVSQAFWALAPACVGLARDLSGGYALPLLAAVAVQAVAAFVFLLTSVHHAKQ